MLLVGLTGGIGMGKSTVAEYLVHQGERVVDTDRLARELVEPGEAALEEIGREFGAGVIDAAGRLDREALGNVVFSGEEARRRLEAILHPRIRAAWREKVEQWRKAGAERGFVVIPLLYETGAEAELGKVICVACTSLTQATRLRARHWNEDEIARRVASQWPVERKIDKADGVIWNESSIEVCKEQTARLLRQW